MTTCVYQVGITGNSLGGMHAWFAAAADDRITAAAPMIGVQVPPHDHACPLRAHPQALCHAIYPPMHTPCLSSASPPAGTPRGLPWCCVLMCSVAARFCNADPNANPNPYSNPTLKTVYNLFQGTPSPFITIYNHA